MKNPACDAVRGRTAEKTMVRRCIGIDISPCGLRAVQIQRIGREFLIEKVFAAPTRRATDCPSDVLRSLTSRHGFDRRSDVAVSMSSEAVFFRNVESDVSGLEELRLRRSASLAREFPIPPDQIVSQVCSSSPLPDGRLSVLTAATSSESLRQRLDVLAAAKMRPVLVEASVLALHAAIAVNHPAVMTGRAIIASVDERHLTLMVSRDNNIVIVRSIPIAPSSPDDVDSGRPRIAELLAAEAQITFRKVFGAEIADDTEIYLVTPDAAADHLKTFVEENLRCRATVVDPCAVVQSPDAGRADLPIHVAEGLALRVLAPELTEGNNFLDTYDAANENQLDLGKEVKTYATLVGAIAFFLIVGLFARLSQLEAGYKGLKSRINEVFKTAVPEERNIVDPVVQLDQKLAAFRKDYQLFASFHPAALDPLQILKSISVSTPAGKDLKVADVLIAGDSVRISGTCDSFESVYQWRNLLQNVPGFAFVEARSPRKDPKTGLVSFTIVVSLAEQEPQ